MTRFVFLLVLCTFVASASAAEESVRHPLDPLTSAELTIVAETLRAAQKVDDDTRFPLIQLAQPPKSEVLGWTPESAIPRTAFVVIKQGDKAAEATVDLIGKKLTSWRDLADVQTSILLEEFFSVGDVIKGNAEWQAAMKKRGFETYDKIYCAPLSAGHFGVKEEEGRRLVRSVCFDSGDTKNFWGRPIEGLVAVVDIGKKEVFKVIDEGVVPVPRSPADYDATAAGMLRVEPPLKIDQPEGVGFKIDGHEIGWQKWRFHARVDPRAGLVIALVRYDDAGRLRPILYEGALSEIFVPYHDPTQSWYFRTYMDAGEYGVGKLAVPLVPGADCPTNAVYMDDVLADDRGAPQKREKVVCVFERPGAGPLWRHFDFLTNESESRRSRELVVRQIAAVGNYDYVFDWTFQQDGTIRVAVGATGIAEVRGVAAKSAADAEGAKAAAYGHFVSENTVAINHDHFLNFRLDLDVDGEKNSFVDDQLKRVKNDGLRKSLWVNQPRTLKREQDARLHMSMEQPSFWRVVNPIALGPVGYPVGYELMPGHNAMSLLAADDFPSKRAGFAAYTLWVTPYSPDQRWAGGAYPNQSKGGDGLPTWTEGNRSIENTDIVVWYTLGFHHIVRAEDWPVMPTSWHEFQLRPFDFFPRNPALDVPKQ